jgi:hypothetical protein
VDPRRWTDQFPDGVDPTGGPTRWTDQFPDEWTHWTHRVDRTQFPDEVDPLVDP